MKWDKQGLIYVPESNEKWRVSHAQLPVVDKVNDDILRVYYGTRNSLNQTVTSYIEVQAEEPHTILYEHGEPVLGLGELGCFDDGGAMPSWIVTYAGMKYLYYIGWNAGITVSYRNSIGLAISDDYGKTYTRMYKGPILDRTVSEPHFCGASCVLVEDGLWRMWYLSCLKWVIINGKSEPIYHIKYTESLDGINWDRRGIVSIELKSPDEGGITRPCVIREDGIYKMWYSYRGKRDYRTNKKNTYRIGYAESKDGIRWERKDHLVGIDVSVDGWDSEMITYAHVYKINNKKYMIYNGNGFGKTGFGYAVMNN